VQDRLSKGAREFLALMGSLAQAVVTTRGLNPATTLVSFFVPQLAVAHALGVDPSTIRRWFYRYPALQNHVAMRRHYTSISAGAESRRTVIDGTVWTVRTAGVGSVRVPLEDLQHQGYRNLDSDIQRAATLAQDAELHASSTGLSKQEHEKRLLGWVFGDRDQAPVGNDACSSVEPEASPALSLEEAVAAVEDGADAGVLAAVVSRELNDRKSFRFWVRQVLFWRARGRLWPFADWVRRALVDAREGFARNPAALLASRLKPRPNPTTPPRSTPA
jgi:hypothetical protein